MDRKCWLSRIRRCCRLPLRGLTICIISCLPLTLQAGLQMHSNHRPGEWRSRQLQAWPLIEPLHIHDLPLGRSTTAQQHEGEGVYSLPLLVDPGSKGQEELARQQVRSQKSCSPSHPTFHPVPALGYTFHLSQVVGCRMQTMGSPRLASSHASFCFG